MCSNFDNLTPEDLASDTSQISTDDEIVCVKRPKMKEIGTMTGKSEISKMKQNADVLFTALNFVADFFKGLFNKANNITLTQVMNYSVLSIILLLFLLFFMLICNVFWVAFSACIFEELNFGRWWSAASIGTLIGSLFVLYFYVIIFCAFLVQINWIGRHPIDIIFA